MSANGNKSVNSARLEFGARMKARRLEKKLTHQRLAAQITYSESMVGHIERGDRTPHQHFTEEVEQVLGFNGELLELLPEIHVDPGPEWFRDWPGIESAAHTIRAYQLALIPGLLQTERYAATLFKGEPAVVPEQVDMAVRARLKRQEILTRPTPPMYSVLLDETVLLRPIGGAEVMSEQLAHLLSMAAHPRITVRIVPLAAGVTAGLLGSFVLAQVERSADAAYLETAETGEVTRQEERVRAISERWDALSHVAQPTFVSEQIIREVMERYAEQ
ncbi:helix-turn-helix domain-containing protein [Nonomuraea jabiensis]|uniref:helix-turn-helix domain-containing protein n=1 Tax=Nonomuraea jabiensis TaxID=882448 RepID=UPI00368D43F3